MKYVFVIRSIITVGFRLVFQRINLKYHEKYGKFLCIIFVIIVQILSAKVMAQNEKSSVDVDSTRVLQAGIPILLNKDLIQGLGIREIEIRDTIDSVEFACQINLPLRLDVDFGRSGNFNGIYLFQHMNTYGHHIFWHEVLAGNYSRSMNFVDYCKPVYHLDFGSTPSDSSSCYSSKFQVSPYEENKSNSGEFETYLNILNALNEKFSLKPFYGRNCLIYLDSTEGELMGNEINLKQFDPSPSLSKSLLTDHDGYSYYDPFSDESSSNQYDIWFTKTTRSDTLHKEIFHAITYYEGNFDIGDLKILDSRSINMVTRDTSDPVFYDYVKNPNSYSYYPDTVEEFENGDTIHYPAGLVTVHVFYSDTVYNNSMWAGFDKISSYNLGGSGNYDESQLFDSTFNSDKASKIPIDDFYINGEPGYDYLLKALNNRWVLTRLGYEDKNSKQYKYIPDQFKQQKDLKEIKKLPKRIIVQVSLTVYWYIELTGKTQSYVK